MIAVDTNILVYAHDARDVRKQTIAAKLIEGLTEGVLLWQVACEFLAASRKLAPQGHSLADAKAALRDLQDAWIETSPAWSALDVAVELISSNSLSFWDGLLAAACEQAGVTLLYSEDLGGQPSLLGVEFINPFVEPLRRSGLRTQLPS